LGALPWKFAKVFGIAHPLSKAPKVPYAGLPVCIAKRCVGRSTRTPRLAIQWSLITRPACPSREHPRNERMPQ
jgi:hypothetical protein